MQCHYIQELQTSQTVPVLLAHPVYDSYDVQSVKSRDFFPTLAHMHGLRTWNSQQSVVFYWSRSLWQDWRKVYVTDIGPHMLLLESVYHKLVQYGILAPNCSRHVTALYQKLSLDLCWVINWQFGPILGTSISHLIEGNLLTCWLSRRQLVRAPMSAVWCRWRSIRRDAATTPGRQRTANVRVNRTKPGTQSAAGIASLV